MNSKNIIKLVCLAGFALASPIIAGDKPGKGGPGHKWESEDQAGRTSSDEDRHGGTREAGEPRRADKRWAFSEEELRTIHAYAQRYDPLPGKHERRLPPGLAKKVARGGNLPPGWEKKCVPGEIMPAQVYAECHPLPPDSVVKLPPPPEPSLTVTVAVQGRVVRLIKATLEILDVFDVQVKL